ncbi:hypothetical protein CGCS363_v003728 [Colletotrichum siamense]|uniref:uncharacterized protein n=1 Tax=Colletotrichum siamense TaxID=690259 RepID=UPI0018727F26|nr:uncharacterized protein CGCS363_v003728 [Colletotrichum siamense]KAF5511334.1 hypothetical protein CGCS363_v003728 [Colletotrichum siamense]
MKPRPSNSGSGAIPPPNPSLQQQPNLNPSARSFTPVAIMPPVAPSAYSPPVQHQVELVYHQAKAAEAAKLMAARAHGMISSPFCSPHTTPKLPIHPLHLTSAARVSSRSRSCPFRLSLIDLLRPLRMPPSHHGLVLRSDSEDPAHTPPTSGSDQMHVPKKRRISNALGGPSDKPPSRSASAPNAAGVAVDHHGIPTTPPNRSVQPQTTTPTPPAYTFDDDDIFFPNADKPLVKSSRGKKKAPSGRK